LERKRLEEEKAEAARQEQLELEREKQRRAEAARRERERIARFVKFNVIACVFGDDDVVVM
jgi:uncharacterized protein with GYD domain